MKTTNITVRGDRDYVKRLKKLAVMTEKDMAELVRIALDKTYGDGIADPEGFSLASVVPLTEQSQSDGKK